jgi:CheY-like chemotaxis protein
VDLEKAMVTTSEMRLPSWKILVVDDNEELCRTAALSLRELGTRPETCLSGEEAIDHIREAKESGEGYFVVLIDYKMKGMSGVETARKIREMEGDKLPISVISAYDWADIEEEAKDAGITGFIAKPLFKSTLYLGLRIYQDEADGADEQKQEKDIDLTGLRILLAEDNDINAEIACVILEESGCIVDRAEDGAIAVSRFENSDLGYYDAVLMDLRMPHMNGIEATEKIRAMQREDAKKIPIIAITADAFVDDAQKCLEAGMNTHLAKPIDIEQLKKTLAKFT